MSIFALLAEVNLEYKTRRTVGPPGQLHIAATMLSWSLDVAHQLEHAHLLGNELKIDLNKVILSYP